MTQLGYTGISVSLFVDKNSLINAKNLPIKSLRIHEEKVRMVPLKLISSDSNSPQVEHKEVYVSLQDFTENRVAQLVQISYSGSRLPNCRHRYTALCGIRTKWPSEKRRLGWSVISYLFL